jgi:hypothetical protein
MSGFTPASLNACLASYKGAGDRVADAFSAGVKAAGLYIQAESMKRVPVEYGNLIGSAGTRAEGSGFSTVVYVYYGTDYAIWVHENLEMALKGQPRPSGLGNYWDGTEGAGRSKYLESVYRDKKEEIERVAGKAARDYLTRHRANAKAAKSRAKAAMTYLPTALI